MKKQGNVLDYSMSGLDQSIWESDGTLKQAVKEDILSKIEPYLQDVPWIETMRILGSLTSFQWNRRSDLDLHIVVDWDKLKAEYPGLSQDDLDEILDSYKDEMRDQQWKVLDTEHPFEVSFETPHMQAHTTDGIYDLKTDTWEQAPRTVDTDFDPESVYSSIIDDAEGMVQELDVAIGNAKRDIKNIDALKEAIETMDSASRSKFQNRLQERTEELENELIAIMDKAQEVSDERDVDYEPDSEENITFKYLQKFGYIWLWKNLEKILGDADENPSLDVSQVDKVEEVLDESSTDMGDKRASKNVPRGTFWRAAEAVYCKDCGSPKPPIEINDDGGCINCQASWTRTAQEPGEPRVIDNQPKAIERGDKPPMPAAAVDEPLKELDDESLATDNETTPQKLTVLSPSDPRPASPTEPADKNPAWKWNDEVTTNVERVLPDLVSMYFEFDPANYKTNVVLTNLDSAEGMVFADVFVELLNKATGVKDGEMRLTLSGTIESGVNPGKDGQEYWDDLADVDVSIEDMKKWASQKKTGAQFGFVGTCVDILEDPSSPFGDATEMAQAVESGVEMTEPEFVDAVGDMSAVPTSKAVSFWKAEDASLVWAYDGAKDIHYFFGRTAAQIPTKTVCAWCGKHLKGDPNAERTSHGMCADCEIEVNNQIDEDEKHDAEFEFEAAISLQPVYVANRILDGITIENLKGMDFEGIQHEIYTWLSRNQLKYTKEDVRKIHDQLSKQTGIEAPPPKEPKPEDVEGVGPQAKPVMPPTPVEEIAKPAQPEQPSAPSSSDEEPALVPGQEPVIKTNPSAPTPRPQPKIISRMMAVKRGSGFVPVDKSDNSVDKSKLSQSDKVPNLHINAAVEKTWQSYFALINNHPHWKTARARGDRSRFEWIPGKCASDKEFVALLELEASLRADARVLKVKADAVDHKENLLNLAFDVMGYEVDPNQTPFLNEKQAETVAKRYHAESAPGYGADKTEKDLYAYLVQLGWVKPATQHAHTDTAPERNDGSQTISPAARDRDRFEDAVETGTKDVFPNAGAPMPTIPVNSTQQLAKDLVKLGTMNENEIVEDLMGQFKITEAQAFDVLDGEIADERN
jgi:hypothetical protein